MRRNIRKRRPNRRYRKLRYGRSKASRALSFANNKARPSYSMVRAMKCQALTAEKKFNDTRSIIQINDAWQLINLNGSIGQGSSQGSRIGDNVFCRYIRVRLHIKQGSDNNTNSIRVMLVQPKSANTATWVPPTLIGSYGYVAQWNIDSYNVIWDKELTIGNTNQVVNTNTGQPVERFMNFNIKVMKTWEYSVNASTTPTCTTPQLFFYVNYPNAQSNGPIVTYYYRITYTDS